MNGECKGRGGKERERDGRGGERRGGRRTAEIKKGEKVKLKGTCGK